MDKVSVQTDIPSPYIERKGNIYRLKRKLTYGFAFRLIKKFLQKRDSPNILEIGTGSGFFLEFIKEVYPAGSFSGVEYDERLIAETASRAPHANLVQGNAEQFDLGHSKFDLIVSFQVIEHLYQPEAMVANVRSHLKPGGLFLVTTPNLDGLGARWMKQKWHGYRDDHVSLKGKDQWDKLIAAHGFVPIYSGSTFFSGIPVLNRLPLGPINWALLATLGSMRWSIGESYVGLFKLND